ncbi:MAG: Fe-S protein assembly co-chaperone HscB [Myxococcales bacterium]|jgi:molecular chaperone HscB|nr:Fe-S protein assembly co-chaperone HscB [Myxococcales bacterium]
MTDPFETLGLPRRFRFERLALEQRHRDLARALHPDRYVEAPALERQLALSKAVTVNEAYRTLRDPLQRALALLRLAGHPIGDRDRPSAEVLMAVMELREALDEARADPARVASLRSQVASAIAECEALVAEAFDAPEGPDPARLDEARAAVIKLRYYRRFEEEADSLEAL